MTSRPENFADLLDAYLDGRLNDQQRADLEATVRADPSLRAEFDRAQLAEAGLKRLFEPPAARELLPDQLLLPASLPFSAHEAPTAPGLPAAAEPSTASRPARRSRAPIWWAAAALVGLAGAAAIYVSNPPAPAVQPPRGKAPLSPAELYAKLEKRKFRPSFVCENDEQFAKFLGDRFGSGAVLAQSAGVEVLGWAYEDGMLGEATAVIMTRYQSQPVVIVVDQKKYDRPLPEPALPLHLFRSECNGMVFYEITPLEAPHILPLVRPSYPLVLNSD